MTRDNVRRFLVGPYQQQFSTHTTDVVPLWVVLDEAPGTSEGYLIMFEDTRGDFGLALKPQGSNPGVMIGFYGTLKDALQGM